MTPHPQGAICVAVYRPDVEYLRTQLESIASQSFEDWNCYIGIDGDDPRTRALIDEIVAGDPRFEVKSFDDNVGFYRNFERTIEVALGSPAQWIALADQDDYWYANKMRDLLGALQDEVSAVSGQARVVDGSGRLLSATDRRPRGHLELLLDNQVTGSLSVFRREVVEAAIPFPEPTTAAYHDHWLGMCALSVGQIVFLDDVVQDYVQHGSNVLGEERGARVAARLARLHDLSSGVGSIEFIARERWGWRVRMAQQLLQRFGTLPPDGHLALIARGKASPAILGEILRAVARRRVPPLRGLSLAVGSVAWPWVTRRSRGT